MLRPTRVPYCQGRDSIIGPSLVEGTEASAVQLIAVDRRGLLVTIRSGTDVARRSRAWIAPIGVGGQGWHTSVMVCPRCGGDQRTQLAPGFFECTTESMRMVPSGAPPGRGDSMRPIYERCGHRYQEGSVSHGLLCSCGMLAVGVCPRCSSTYCGRHMGVLIDRQQLCESCAAEVQREAEDAAAQAHEAQLAAMPEATPAAIRTRLENGGRLDELRWVPLSGPELAPLMPDDLLADVYYDTLHRRLGKDIDLRFRAWRLAHMPDSGTTLILTEEGEVWLVGESRIAGKSRYNGIRLGPDTRFSAWETRSVLVHAYPNRQWMGPNSVGFGGWEWYKWRPKR